MTDGRPFTAIDAMRMIKAGKTLQLALLAARSQYKRRMALSAGLTEEQLDQLIVRAKALKAEGKLAEEKKREKRKRWRPKESYRAKTPEARERQLANLRPGWQKGPKLILTATGAIIPDLGNPDYEQDIIKFLEEQFYVPEKWEHGEWVRKSGPIKLLPWQKKYLFHPVFYREPHPTMALWSMIKKSGKSAMSAAVASWYLYAGPPESELYFAARDLEQASLINFRRLRAAVRLNKRMFDRSKIYKDSIENTRTGTVLRCLPADVSAAGLAPRFIGIDELWSFNKPRHVDFFNEIAIAVPTVTAPLVLITTYAGYSDETDSILWQLYDKGIKGEHDEGMYFWWDHLPRCPWLTKKYLANQRSRLRESVYLRLWENKWVQSEEAFITGAQWDGVVNPTLQREMPAGDGVMIGLDVGLKRDTTGIVAVTKEGGKYRIVDHRHFIPEGGTLDLETTAEAAIEELAKRYPVWKVLFDPFQAIGTAQRLTRKGIVCEEYPQTPDRLILMTEHLHSLIVNRQLETYFDPDIRAHVLHCVAKEHGDRGSRLVKKSQNQKIDLAIALAMACIGWYGKQPASGFIVSGNFLDSPYWGGGVGSLL